MASFSFRSVTGSIVTVVADDEATGRSRAMEALWGKFPQSIGSPPIVMERAEGSGLDLVDVRD